MTFWSKIRKASLTRCWWHRVHAFKRHHGKIKQWGKSLVSARMRRVKQRKRWKTREGLEIAFVVVFCIYRFYRREPPYLTFVFTQELSICSYVHCQGSKSKSKKGNRQKHSAIRSAVEFSFLYTYVYRKIVCISSVFLYSPTVFPSLAMSEFCYLASRNHKIVELCRINNDIRECSWIQ